MMDLFRALYSDPRPLDALICPNTRFGARRSAFPGRVPPQASSLPLRRRAYLADAPPARIDQ